MQKCLCEFAFVTGKLEFEARRVHKPSEVNRIPDLLSRWSLHKEPNRKFEQMIGHEPVYFYAPFTQEGPVEDKGNICLY